MRGKRITTLRQLMALATKRAAVTGASGMFRRHPLPAAWVVNMPGPQILRLFDGGLYHYRKEPK